MADDFDIDNEGSGFALEDGQDINSLLNRAREGEDPQDNIDTNWLFQEDGTPPEEAEPTPVPTPEPEPVAEEPVFEVPVDEPPVEVEPEPVVEEESYFDAIPPNDPEVSAPVERRVHLPTAADELARVSQVVRVLNAYRDLNPDEQEAVSQFLTNGEIIREEPEFIVAVLNADKTLAKAMTALREAKALEPVDRAFYVIELSENLINYLCGLVAVFTDEEIDRKQSRGQYTKALVRTIEKLDDKSMKYVTATASVLEAAAGPAE